MKPPAKCLCGQLITDTPGWRFQHWLAHERRGEAKAVKSTTEKDGHFLTFTTFEWLVKKPKPIMGTHPYRRQK